MTHHKLKVRGIERLYECSIMQQYVFFAHDIKIYSSLRNREIFPPVFFRLNRVHKQILSNYGHEICEITLGVIPRESMRPSIRKFRTLANGLLTKSINRKEFDANIILLILIISESIAIIDQNSHGIIMRLCYYLSQVIIKRNFAPVLSFSLYVLSGIVIAIVLSVALLLQGII